MPMSGHSHKPVKWESLGEAQASAFKISPCDFGAASRASAVSPELFLCRGLGMGAHALLPLGER